MLPLDHDIFFIWGEFGLRTAELKGGRVSYRKTPRVFSTREVFLLVDLSTTCLPSEGVWAVVYFLV